MLKKHKKEIPYQKEKGIVEKLFNKKLFWSVIVKRRGDYPLKRY